MADTKKYYWLKLKDDFFRDKRIKKLRRIAGGDTYTVIYLKMQLLSIKNSGVLIYEGIEDNFAEELALELDEDTENVKVTLAFLQGNGMIEETDPNHFLMTETIKCIGSESASAERVRKHRERKAQKMLQCNTEETNSNTEIEKEKEKERELELETEKETELTALSPNGEDTERNKAEVISYEEIAFNEFWSAYPKKVNKKGCYKSFCKIKNLKAEMPLIMDALERFKASKGWLKDNGQFIPHPTTWINQERWKDEQAETREDKLKTIDMDGWL